MDNCIDIGWLDPYLNPVKIIDYHKANLYIKYGYFFCEDIYGNLCLVVRDRKLLNRIKNPQKYKIFLISEEDFYYILEKNFSSYNSMKAVLDLGFKNHNFTARNIDYVTRVIGIILPILVIGYISKILFLSLNYLIFLSQNLLKLFLFVMGAIYRHCEEPLGRCGHPLLICSGLLRHSVPSNDNTEMTVGYPLYSILVPMYKERTGALAIIEYLKQLDYPKARLDVKLVVEEDDHQVIAVLDSTVLPDYFHIIRVPYSFPRTKPKALNYAMEYIKGEYVVIYDVEDRPEKDQLIKAVDAFQKFPENVVCVQAKLNFYNKNTNLLSKFFSMEYRIWFDFLLPGLDAAEMPIPLGGNSNHFKVDEIRKLGLWDAYNVTEDADLGLRIFMHGYRTRMIDSYTFEEAPAEVSNWLYQRARWIKGFIQTFFVFLRQNKANMSIISKIVAYIFIGFATYGFLILPWLIVVQNPQMFRMNDFLYDANIYTTLLYMYYSASVAVSIDTKSFRGIKLLDFTALLFWPFYFILHIIGAYMALWQLIVNPFYWNKTQHKVLS